MEIIRLNKCTLYNIYVVMYIVYLVYGVIITVSEWQTKFNSNMFLGRVKKLKLNTQNTAFCPKRTKGREILLAIMIIFFRFFLLVYFCWLNKAKKERKNTFTINTQRWASFPFCSFYPNVYTDKYFTLRENSQL